MLETCTKILLSFTRKKTTLPYRIISLFIGMVIFLVAVPAAFYFAGVMINLFFPITWPRTLEITVAGVAIPAGLFFLAWATKSQWRIGQGTPAPNAPTRHLVVLGPYKLCRNPIEFGAILYYLGIGSLIGNLTIGVVCAVLGFATGSTYHKWVEEKELELRFGEEYLDYKRKTPFLIPRFWKIGKDRDLA
jgi:protein-S-isoprenylcysteine O-methyltransferase Ste14